MSAQDRALVCEGPDDRAAIHALLRHWGLKQRDSSMPKATVWTSPEVSLLVAVADGKPDLARRLTTTQTASCRPTMVGVSFDPDSDPKAKEREFLRKDFAKLQRAGSLESDTQGLVWKTRNQSVSIHFGAWREPGGFLRDALPDDWHSLERVLLSGVWSALSPSEAQWLEDAITKLGDVVPRDRWKQALHLANALVDPSVGGPAFVDRLFQAERTKHHCLKALLASEATAMLERVAGRTT